MTLQVAVPMRTFTNGTSGGILPKVRRINNGAGTPGILRVPQWR